MLDSSFGVFASQHIEAFRDNTGFYAHVIEMTNEVISFI